MAGTITSIIRLLSRADGGLDQADQALPMPGAVAVEDLVDLGATHEEVDVVLPGEADAAVQLERLAAEVGEGVVDVGTRGGHAPRRRRPSASPRASAA